MVSKFFSLYFSSVHEFSFLTCLPDDYFQDEKEKRRAEVRARMEQAAAAKKKRGFMTPARKKKLRVSDLTCYTVSTWLFACYLNSFTLCVCVCRTWFVLSLPKNWRKNKQEKQLKEKGFLKKELVFQRILTHAMKLNCNKFAKNTMSESRN